jgi:tetratricopeptide (TPR) repeat protein
MERGQFDTALGYYQQACEYPRNLEVAPPTPDMRAHVYWNLVRVYQALGDAEAAADYAAKILAERYERPSIGWYFQAMAHRAVGDQAAYRAGIERLEAAAREMTSSPAAPSRRWRFGSRQAIGLYLLSLVLEEKGEAAQAAADRAEALTQDPHVESAALWQAQRDLRRANQ